MSLDAPNGSHLRVAIGLLTVGAIARLLPHAPNVSPVAALALFGGTVLPRRWAVVLPVAILAITDVILGWHDVIAFTWMGAALIGLTGLWVRRQSVRPGRLIIASLWSSTIFFLVTNFGVWLMGESGTMYPHTRAGLWQCFVAALPFYRLGVLGDLAWTGAIFGLYHFVTMRAATPAAVRAHS